jgi:hypothetical protein
MGVAMNRKKLEGVIKQGIYKVLKESMNYSEQNDFVDEPGSSPPIPSNLIDDATNLLASVCNKIMSTKEKSVDTEALAKAVSYIEKADQVLRDAGLMEEGFSDSDRMQTITQIQTTARSILNSVAMSRIPDGALNAVAANLTAVANKLRS